MTPHNLLFLTHSETLTLIFLLSHHLHVAAVALAVGRHRTFVDLPPSRQPPSYRTTSLAREPPAAPLRQPPSSRMTSPAREPLAALHSRLIFPVHHVATIVVLPPESPWLHHHRTTSRPTTATPRLLTIRAATNAELHCVVFAPPPSSFSTLSKPPFTVCTFVIAATFMATPCSNTKS